MLYNPQHRFQLWMALSCGGLLSRKVAWRQQKARLERPSSLTYNPWTLANSWALAIICHTDVGTKSRFMGLRSTEPLVPSTP